MNTILIIHIMFNNNQGTFSSLREIWFNVIGPHFKIGECAILDIVHVLVIATRYRLAFCQFLS